jgi:hypothetical protein
MFQRTRIPAFAIAFVGSRFFFSRVKFILNSELTRKTVVENLSRIYFPDSTSFRKNIPTEKSDWVFQARFVVRRILVENSRRAIQAETVEPKSKNSRVRNSALSKPDFCRIKFSMNGKCFKLLIVCRLPSVLNLLPTDACMISATSVS